MVKRQSKTKPIYQAALYAALLALMGLSWYFSGLSGSQSNVYSFKLANALAGYYGAELDYIPAIDAINWAVRKLAHLIEYGLMGLVLCAMLNSLLKKPGLAALATLAVMSAWAVADELHQSLAVGRYSRWLDVGIDITGVLVAIFLVSVVVYIRRLRIQNVGLMHEIHLLTINQKIWDNLIPRLAGNREDAVENRQDAPLLMPRETAEGGC